ncbi:MAG TPA: hypothetical protein VGB79_17585 [Allosphingosinicella sp.]
MSGAVRSARLSLARIPILVLRRFVAPIAAATFPVGTLLTLVLVVSSGLSFADMDVFYLFFVLPAVLFGAGILVVGIPAGYLVARLRWHYGASMALLVAIGFAAGLAIPIVIWGAGESALFEAFICSLAGAGVAAVWAPINRDLFRRDDGA